jgi:lipid-A-disaccharide synthase
MSAAEASGDEHAARLIRSLRKRLGPEVRFVGAAGPHMAEAGCEVLADFTVHASMLLEPVLRLPYWLRAISRLKRQIAEIRPDIHIPVDSPGMNWHLASAAKAAAGSSTIWAILPNGST